MMGSPRMIVNSLAFCTRLDLRLGEHLEITTIAGDKETPRQIPHAPSGLKGGDKRAPE